MPPRSCPTTFGRLRPSRSFLCAPPLAPALLLRLAPPSAGTCGDPLPCMPVRSHPLNPARPQAVPVPARSLLQVRSSRDGVYHIVEISTPPRVGELSRLTGFSSLLTKSVFCKKRHAARQSVRSMRTNPWINPGLGAKTPACAALAEPSILDRLGATPCGSATTALDSPKVTVVAIWISGSCASTQAG